MNVYLELFDYICTEAYIGGTSSHVQRLLVHVHMYTIGRTYLMQRRCTSLLIRGKEWETLYFPHLTPPLAFSPGRKKIFYTPYHMNFAQGKKMPVVWRAMLWHK